MASAHFKPISLAVAASLSLVLMEGTAFAENKQHDQEPVQTQGAGPQGSDLTAEQLKALESEISRLWAQGRYAEATKLQHRAVKWREIHSGPNHPQTATSIYKLAFFYYHQQLHNKAEPHYLRVLAINEKAKKLLNYKPTHKIEKGIKETVNWFVNKY